MSRRTLGVSLWLSIVAAGAVTGCEALIGLKDRHEVRSDGGVDDSPKASKAACAEYCKQVQDTCDDVYTLYPPKDGGAACRAFCALLSENELACRQDQRLMAASSQELYTYCQGAGPGGSEACGSNCESYCEAMELACSEQEGTTEKTVGSCETKCSVLVDRDTTAQARESRFDVKVDHEGDTLQCRLVHVVNAALTPKEHCWHAALAPHKLGTDLNPCATDIAMKEPLCSDYCHIVVGSCTGDHAVYESEAQCLATCAKLDPGLAADDGGQNTVGCRKAHAYNALVTEMYDTHCPHAGPGGRGICGDDCTPYCSLLEAGCSDGYEAAFGTGAPAAKSCTDACGKLIGDGGLDYSVAAGEGPDEPLACRMLNVTRALEKPDMAATFCPSALGMGDCK